MEIMSMYIEIPDLSENGVAARLGSLLRLSRSPWAIMQVAGKALSNELRAWFLLRNAEPNKMGWPSQNFWSRIRNATAVGEVTATQASVSISDPAIRLKLFGGRVRPKRGQNLAIPARAEAYAAGSPREGAHPPLKFAFAFDDQIQKWRPALIAEDPGMKTLRRKTKKGEVRTKTVEDKKQPAGIWYWLVKSTWHQPDPDALPPTEQMQSAILAAAQNFMLNRALLEKTS